MIFSADVNNTWKEIHRDQRDEVIGPKRRELKVLQENWQWVVVTQLPQHS
jgi:hypothetical protein